MTPNPQLQINGSIITYDVVSMKDILHSYVCTVHINNKYALYICHYSSDYTMIYDILSKNKFAGNKQFSISKID